MHRARHSRGLLCHVPRAQDGLPTSQGCNKVVLRWQRVPAAVSRTAQAPEHVEGTALQLQQGLSPPVLELYCSWGGPCVSPQQQGLGRNGACGTAAPRGNGLRNPRGGKPLREHRQLRPELSEAPASPARCPAEISSQLAGLDGKRPHVPSTAGPPGNPGETGTAAAPALLPCPGACPAPQCRGLALCCHPMCWQPRGKAGVVRRRKGTAAALRLPAPCLPQPGWGGDLVPSWPVSPRAGAARAGAPPTALPTAAASSAHAQPSARDERGSLGALVAARRSRHVPAVLSDAAAQGCPWGLRSSMG